ncbi:DUF6470 family protein [Microaerobacter geothermalis]|uniref:DUF6470 family protein n=1 Tax=Microaerobacter geothermalis TaxID=674972 RepID=UPI001F482126|nr:DUF6470 family protein [Microaerobacter geothermalis]MCF6093416.1 DUF6470 family protein [Microaerobacter geothermalis]
MQLPRIQIEQTYAQIGIKTTPSTQEIRQPQADLNLRQIPAKLEIERIPSRLNIDQSQAWAEVNLKDPIQLTRDESERAKQLALEGIARIVEEGNQLAAIENQGDSIAEIALQNTITGPVDYNVGFIPSYGSVRIDYQPAQLNFNWTINGVEMNPVIKQPEISYQPGKVEVYVKQKNSISFQVVGLYKDLRI